MAESQNRKVDITTTGAASVKISDYVVATYTQIITVWAGVVSTNLDPITYEITPGFASFTVMNDVTVGGQAKFSKIAGLMDAVVEIYQGATKIFKGKVDHLSNIGQAYCTVNCVCNDAEYSKKFDYMTVNLTDFPNAEVSDLGKMLPMVYGTPKRVPFMRLNAGAFGAIGIPIESTTTSIPKTYFPSQMASSGTLLIGGERIPYTTSGSNFALTRGPGARYHPRGTATETYSETHVYGIGNAVASIDAVYSGGVLVPASAYTVDLNGDATYPGATITFGGDASPVQAAVNPITTQASFLYGDDTGSPSSECPAPSSAGLYVKELATDTVYPTGTTPPGAGLAYDLNESTCYDSLIHGSASYSGEQAFFVTFSDDSGIRAKLPESGVVGKIRVLCETYGAAADTTLTGRWTTNPGGYDPSPFTFSGDPSTGKQWLEQEFTMNSPTTIGGVIGLLWTNAANSELKVYEVYLEFNQQEDVAPSTVQAESEDIRVYPVYQNDPLDADNSAFDRDVSTYYDTAVDAPDTAGQPELLFPELCNAGVVGEIESISLVTVLEATADTTVMVSSTGGITKSAVSIDPTGGATTTTTTGCTHVSNLLQSTVNFTYSTGELKIYECYFLITLKSIGTGSNASSE